jgi:hypothetical protein
MQRRVFSIAVAVLGLVALACTCSLPKLGGGPVPSATVAVSQEAANRMKKKLDQASAQVKSGGQFKLTLTESEITSYVVQELGKSQDRGEPAPLTNPQIKLTQNQVWVYGTFIAGTSKFNGLLVVSPTVQSGKLAIKIVRADFGPVPVPGPVLDQINQQIQSLFDKESSQDIVLTAITIREGEVDVTGKGK